MNIDDYLVLIGKQISSAASRGDKDETLRLFRLLKEVADEQIAKVLNLDVPGIKE